MAQALIIDSHPEGQSQLAKALQQAMPRVQTLRYRDLQQASQALKTQRIDLCLLPAQPLAHDHFAALKALKQRHPQCHWVMTATQRELHLLSPALQAGADGFLLKDESHAQMARALEEFAVGRPVLSAAAAQQLIQTVRHQSVFDTATRTHDWQGNSAHLTPRQTEILLHLAEGKTGSHIAQDLSLSAHTVAKHIKNIYQRLSIHSRAEAACAAMQLGLIR